MSPEDTRLALKLAEFAALVQGGHGLVSKAPSYLLEKWATIHGNGGTLDTMNSLTFLDWKRAWAPLLEEAGAK